MASRSAIQAATLYLQGDVRHGDRGQGCQCSASVAWTPAICCPFFFPNAVSA
jgi:hypothetical protein